MWRARITQLTMWRPTLRFNFRHVLQVLWERLRWVFWPRTCLACGKDLPASAKGLVCAACEQGLTLPGPLVCQRCGVVLKNGGAHCFHCRGSKAATYKCKVIRSACAFNASSRGLIYALKYQGMIYTAGYMGELMARRFSYYPELAGANLVVPVPLFSKRCRQRGYNQSELLARAFCKHTGLPLDYISLERVRDTASQTKLGRAARQENMADAFCIKNPTAVKGKTVLLIDDVATTGSTLEACAVALRLAGAKRVLAYTFAREN